MENPRERRSSLGRHSEGRASVGEGEDAALRFSNCSLAPVDATAPMDTEELLRNSDSGEPPTASGERLMRTPPVRVAPSSGDCCCVGPSMPIASPWHVFACFNANAMSAAGSWNGSVARLRAAMTSHVHRCCALQGQVPACMQQSAEQELRSPAAPSPSAPTPEVVTPSARVQQARSPAVPGSGNGLQITPPLRQSSEVAPSPREPSPLAQMSVYQLLQLTGLDTAFDAVSLPEDLQFHAAGHPAQVLTLFCFKRLGHV